MDDALLTAATLVASTLRMATPLVLAALAGVIAERAGVIDLGLEGKMLATAFAAGAAGAATGSFALAIGSAIGVGVLLSLLHAWGCVRHRGDQVVMGMAITMTAAGLTVVLGLAWFRQGGQTPPLPDTVRLSPWFTGAGEAIAAAVPGMGPALALAFAGHHGLVWLALVLVAATWWALYRTRWGLRLRATGENPAMVDAAGLSVARLRTQALVANGVLCALAGACLVLGLNSAFAPNMTAGRGYMALAAMIFGKWHPVGALAACGLFGFLDALSIRLQGAALPALLGGGEVPVQAIQALPYGLTVVLLAGFVGAARAPKALGVPYVKER
jgi:simple sugar transport system permease protein